MSVMNYLGLDRCMFFNSLGEDGVVIDNALDTQLVKNLR